jgi:signal transduction histidine kinase
MDNPTAQIRPPEGGPTVAGAAFAEALHEGLIRATRRTPDAPPPTARFAAPPRTAPPRRTAPPARAARDGGRAGTPSPVLPETEREEVLRRFRLALPAVLPPPDRERPALTSALVSFARRVLAHAGRTGSPSGPARPFLPPATEVGPHHLVAAVGLLYECALLEVMERSADSAEPGLGDTAPHRALAAVQALADALRAAGVDFWRGDDGWSESRRLARRLHDELGSTLAVALHRVQLGEDDPAGAAAHLAVARKALHEAVEENRGLIAGLRRSTRTPPLRLALEAFLADLAPHADVDVHLVGDETVAPEPCRRELLLVLREALRNALAHAGAARIEVTVRTTRRWVYARVEDDGVGFDVRGVLDDPRTGHGLDSVRERVEDLGGRLRITSAVGAGTRTELHLPLVPRP